MSVHVSIEDNNGKHFCNIEFTDEMWTTIATSAAASNRSIEEFFADALGWFLDKSFGVDENETGR